MGLKQTRGPPSLTLVPREVHPMHFIEFSHFRKFMLAFAAPTWTASGHSSKAQAGFSLQARGSPCSQNCVQNLSILEGSETALNSNFMTPCGGRSRLKGEVSRQ